jgi:hypothetical protein
MCPQIEPDFTEVVDLEAGKYQARITDVEAKTGTSEKATPYLRWTLEVEGNETPALNGRKFFHNTMLKGPGAGMFKAFVRAALANDYNGGAIDTDELLGKSISCVLKDGKNKDGSLTGFPEVKSVTKVKADA